MLGSRVRTLLSRPIGAFRSRRHRVGVRSSPDPSAANALPPGNNWPVQPARAESLFAIAPLEFISLAPTSHGVAGALKATVAFPEHGAQLDVKWKVAPREKLDSWNNSPRKELANYVVQRWFLDAEDYVVPTVGLRAVPLAAYRRHAPDARPTVEGTDCVFGA